MDGRSDRSPDVRNVYPRGRLIVRPAMCERHFPLDSVVIGVKGE